MYENTNTTFTCTVDRIKPASATVRWTFRSSQYLGDTTRHETEELGVYKLVNTYTRQFSKSDSGQWFQCTVEPKPGQGSVRHTLRRIDVYCKYTPSWAWIRQWPVDNWAMFTNWPDVLWIKFERKYLLHYDCDGALGEQHLFSNKIRAIIFFRRRTYAPDYQLVSA